MTALLLIFLLAAAAGVRADDVVCGAPKECKCRDTWMFLDEEHSGCSKTAQHTTGWCYVNEACEGAQQSFKDHKWFFVDCTLCDANGKPYPESYFLSTPATTSTPKLPDVTHDTTTTDAPEFTGNAPPPPSTKSSETTSTPPPTPPTTATPAATPPPTPPPTPPTTTAAAATTMSPSSASPTPPTTNGEISKAQSSINPTTPSSLKTTAIITTPSAPPMVCGGTQFGCCPDKYMLVDTACEDADCGNCLETTGEGMMVGGCGGTRFGCCLGGDDLSDTSCEDANCSNCIGGSTGNVEIKGKKTALVVCLVVALLLLIGGGMATWYHRRPPTRQPPQTVQHNPQERHVQNQYYHPSGGSEDQSAANNGGGNVLSPYAAASEFKSVSIEAVTKC